MSGALEGILFLCGDEGITKSELQKILEIDELTLENIFVELKESYTNNNRGIQVETYGDICKLITKKEHLDYYKKLVDSDITRPLTPTTLEVLAIVAYNQPITRLDVDNIRGIGSSHIIRKLVLRNLIEEAGRDDSPGRPILYKTTSTFLDYFGLKSIEDLPEIEDIPEKEIEASDLFSTKYTENI